MIGTYVCLSYTWGPSNSYVTTPSTYRANLDGINYNSLPRTYKDTITVTTILGIPFLWIDGLCIIQGDEGSADWKEQSSQMADIYANAILVIAAANSTSVEDGFLNASQDTRNIISFESETHADGNSQSGMTVHARPMLDHSWLGWSTLAEPKSEGTLSRSWCFQEEVLAARLLTFYGGEMNFQCLGDVYSCECGFPAEALGLVTIKELYEPRLSLGDYETPNWMWQSTVEHYTRRKLTVGTDRLTALSGVVRIMQSALKTRYIAGHWWDRDFLCSLCWMPVRNEETEGRLTDDYVAPSWSWAAHNGPVTMWIPYGDSKDQQSPRFLGDTIVKDVRMYHSTSDATGAVAGGFITVRGVFLPVRIKITSVERSTAVMSRNNVDIPFYFDRPVGSANLSGMFFCWVVCCLPTVSLGRGQQSEAYCLMFLRSKPEGVCERIGFTDHEAAATDKSMVFFQGYRKAIRVATIV
ncbi:heterokaryon incompatibility protein [Colletotrichum karsti]|uniref:Heterokaryon incompatibility protein n=1 Tax=Colletotrichum karsti TaxID=1095194 RepID=A0A9P6HU34_9PEZI|nr:heterokaryon incompatibility protein [Colletotrichum karsti]KAF9871032.1 heterokaryon incompatibility protein [Colletotrichum karsti]